MLGNGVVRPRYPAVRALVAGAAILAGASSLASSVRENSAAVVVDQRFVQPLIGHSAQSWAWTESSGDVSLPPHPSLPPQTVAATGSRGGRLAFQSRTPIPGTVGALQPSEIIAAGGDVLLAGRLLALRLAASRAESVARMVSAQLERRAGLIQALRNPAALVLKAPASRATGQVASLAPAARKPDPLDRLLARNPALDRTVRDRARAGRADVALRHLVRTRGLRPLYGAQLRAEIAQILFSQGEDTRAVALAGVAHRQSGGQLALPPFVAGLAAWRLERMDLAGPFFAAAAQAPLATPDMRSAAAFWAARVARHSRNPAGHRPWMEQAARDGGTFYGQIARRVLGLRAPVRAASAAGRRLGGPPGTPVLRPNGGFRTDPALIYAMARLESNFDPAAVSPAGARGLLQIMPVTANYIARDARNPAPPLEEEELFRRLHDPATNLDLGQRYLLHLAALDLVGGDLIRVLASYNAGPGSLGRWDVAMRHGGDPLLFIESIPNDETRAYVQQALAWSWLYADQLRQPSPSLDELASGAWPRFRTLAARREVAYTGHRAPRRARPRRARRRR